MSDLNNEGFGERASGYPSERVHEPPKREPDLIAENDSAEGVHELAQHLEAKWKDAGLSDSGENPIIDRRYVNHQTGEDIPQDKILSVKEVGRDLGIVHKVEAEQKQHNADQELASKVDDARTNWHYQNDPAFRQEYDALVQQQQPEQPQQPQPDAQQPADPNDEFVKAWEKTDPKIRQALEAQVGQVQAAQQAYIDAAKQQAQFVARSVFHDFPELQNQSAEGMQAVVNAYSRTNPERAAQIQMRVHDAMVVAQAAEQAQAQQRQQRAQQQSQQFKQFVDSEDKKFMDKHPELADVKSRTEIGEAAVRTLEAAGVSKEELRRSYFNGEGLSLRSAAAQEIILKAALYDRAKAGIEHADRPVVAPTQRPGTYRGPSNGADENIQALERKVMKTGSLRDAAALRLAKMRLQRG